MAISKVIYKSSASATPEVWMDVTQDTVTTNTLLSTYTATKNDGTKITGTYSGGTSTDFIVTVSKNEVTGYWEPDATYSEISAAYSAGKTITVNAAEESGGTAEGYWYEDAPPNPSFLYYLVSEAIWDGETLIGYKHSVYDFMSTGVVEEFSRMSYDTSLGNAVASDVAYGKVFYNASGYSVGTYALPSGTLSISQNGIGIDVASYASVDVSVSGGGGGTDVADEIIQRTIAGSYTNSTVSVIGSYAFCDCTQLSAVSFPNCTSVGSTAFYHCTELSAVSLPSCIQLDHGAFSSCFKLTTVYLPSISTISSYAFCNCSILTDLTTASLYSIGSNAFGSCASLSSVNFSASMSEIGSYAFTKTKLSTLNLGRINDIGTAAFRSCSSLSEFTASYVGYIRATAFANCGLQRVSISGASPSIFAYGSSAFYSCLSLSTVYISQTVSTQYYTVTQGDFYYCINLKLACFKGVRAFVGSSTFYTCTNLLSLYILTKSTAIATLGNINAFAYTPISTNTTSTGGVYGSIFVPESMYSSYITATNWATYSSRFVSMTDAEIETFLSNLT